MYYRIHYSLDPKETGNPAAQSIFERNDIYVEHPLHFNQFHLKKANDIQAVVTPKPILEKKAKRTDLVSTGFGGGVRLTISNKLKKILDKPQHPGIQFFLTSIIEGDIEIPDYWITNPFAFDYDSIDFEKSSFSIRGLGGVKISEIKVKDLTHFLSLISTLIAPEGIFIDTLYITPETKKDLLIVRWVYGGIGYYVSERLKKEIEDAGCTGIVFTKPEEQYP